MRLDAARGPRGVLRAVSRAVGPAAGAAAAAVAFVPAAGAAPTLTELVARPTYFTPNGDGITDSTVVSFRAGGDSAQVTVRVEIVELAGGTLLTTLLPDSTVTAGDAVAVTWAPGAGPDGSYRFDVFVREAADSVSQSVTVTTDTVTPGVTLGAVGPPVFDPNDDPPANRLTVPLTVTGGDATTFVRVLQGSTSVDTLGTFAGAGADTMYWDGETQAGVLAASGAYVVRAIASDLAGNADTAFANVTLDHDPPAFADATPDTVQTDAFPVVLSGTVTDTDRVASVRYSVDAGSTYVDVDTMSPAGPSVDWSTSVDLSGVAPGRHSVRLQAEDALGHTATVTQVIAYDTVLPVPVGTQVVSGAARDGKHLQIRTDWNLSGLHVTADFKLLDFGYVKGTETVTEDSPGSYLIDYRVTPSNIRATGTYLVTVQASTGIVHAADSVTVQLVASELGAGEIVTISANRFDPDAGETVTFAGERNTTPLRVDIFNLSGRPVRVLEGAGYLEWDGRSDGGRPVASGVYFLRVRSEGAEELRKVAVLRGGGS